MGQRTDRDYDWYFRACFGPVARTVFLIVHDRELAEDVTQEALYRMLRHWRTVSTYDSPEAWVRRVAIRIAVREVQRAAARPAKVRVAQRRQYDDLPDPDVARAVAELAPMQRAAVVLYYWEDRPVHEVARRSSTSPTRPSSSTSTGPATGWPSCSARR